MAFSAIRQGMFLLLARTERGVIRVGGAAPSD